MSQTKKGSLLTRLAFVLGGLATLLLAGFFLWAGFSAPLSSRRPVPSPDGKYFAYFNRSEDANGSGSDELIVARPQGRLLARLQLAPGELSWSNADHLVVVDEAGTQATLVANADERFVVVTRIPLNPGAAPLWAPDGNKLAIVRAVEAGPQLAMFDVQQPQAFPIPLPEGIRLVQPRLLSWSPGGEYLFFLNTQGPESVLQTVEVRSGNVKVLERGATPPAQRAPQVSPDGTKVYLRSPQNAVISAQTGETLWTLPPRSDGLWRPWSPDSAGLFFSREDRPTEIFLHDFANASDQVVISGARPNGFFAQDGRTYFFRDPLPPTQSPDSGPDDWQRDNWGWQQADRSSPTPQSLGRVELWPWEQTLDGMVLARQDEYTKVRFGLYDPEVRTFEPYSFPTDEADFRRQMRAHRLALFTVAIFVFLAAVVLATRSGSASGRAFYILSLVVMALICARLTGTLEGAEKITSPFRMGPEEMQALGWSMSSALPQFVFSRLSLVLSGLWALLPLVALHFGLVFPDTSRAVVPKKSLRLTLYGLGLLPLAGGILGRFVNGFPPTAQRGLVYLAGAAATGVWIFNLVRNYQNPQSKRSGQQARWVIAALGVLAVGSLVILLALYEEGSAPAENWRRVLHAVHSILMVVVGCLVPSAIAYAVVAQKPTSVRLFLRRLALQVLMGVPALAVFLLVWNGAGLVMSGAFWARSVPAIVVAVLVTVVVILPFRGRLRRILDHTFERARFELREKLADFARGLPHTVDREALALQLDETLSRALGARWALLFVLDRSARQLRLQPASRKLPSEVRGVAFTPGEPLCEFLLGEQGPFEPEVASLDSELAPLLESAGERLAELQAQVVFALRWQEDVLGLLVLGPKTTGGMYRSDEIEMLMPVVREASAAAENIELFEVAARDREQRRELEDASEIQAKLLPTDVPVLRSAQIVGRCFPSRLTCGDYYDFLDLPGHRMGLALCDVPGRGMAAALMTTSIAGVLRGHASTAASLPEILQRINRQLVASAGESKLCKFFYGVYDDASRRLEYVNAGHDPPILLTEEGARFLEATGLPLGIFPEVTHESRSMILEPGAILLMYSDGIVEAHNSRGETFGADRLAIVLVEARTSDAERALGRILAEIRDFEGGVSLDDDQTLVLLKVNPL